MNYKALNSNHIKLGAHGQLDYDAKEGVVLIPPADTKVFLHWLNENGKMTATYTLTHSTVVYSKIRIINGSANQISIHAITL